MVNMDEKVLKSSFLGLISRFESGIKMGKYEKIDTGGSDSEERHRKCFTLLMYK